MSFNYDKHKHHEGGHEWVAFSDLYLALSTVFLFLFVVASMRTGTTAIQSQVKVQELARQAEDLKQQIKVYETLKKDYLANQATQDEQQVYNELMDKLTLLKEEAKEEKESLHQQALENEKKEMALNKYQQMIRNIINSNLVAQARIKRRDNIIVEKDERIGDQQVEITQLERDIAEKRKAIEQGEKKIASINSELDRRVKQLKHAYENNEITRKNFEAQTAKLRQESQSRVAALREENHRITGQLVDVSSELSEKEKALQSAASTIALKEQETNRLKGELEGADAKARAQAAELKRKFEEERDRDRGRFEAELAAQKLSAAARAAKESQFRAAAAVKERELGRKIAELHSDLKGTEGELAKARELANARKKLARKIMENFAKNGIKADVDAGTGDVLLDFGDAYFETGRADLKPRMRTVLEKTIPVYSASLFNDAKIADKIQGIEIIGFASPTYKGKFVDPSSLQPGDRKAVDYNLDLSYSRAKAIFNHVFDTNKMQFKHQRDLLPLVKVTGRSFLAEAKNRSRGVASGMSQKKFCEIHDCKKAQRVIIKFNLGE